MGLPGAVFPIRTHVSPWSSYVLGTAISHRKTSQLCVQRVLQLLRIAEETRNRIVSSVKRSTVLHATWTW